MKTLRIILFILMIISAISAAGYTLYKMPDYLGLCSERTILFPNDNDIEVVQKVIGISFPYETKVKRIKCTCVFTDPDMFSFYIYMKLPQNDESKQFIESYYSIDKMTIKDKENNEKSYNRNGNFLIKTTKNIKDYKLAETLKEMSRSTKPLTGILWIITIVFIVLYKKINKKYEMYYQK